MLLHIRMKCKLAIIRTFIILAHVSEVISTMWLIFGSEIPHCVGTWATKIEIFNALFTKLSLKEAENIKIGYQNHRILITNMYVDPHM